MTEQNYPTYRAKIGITNDVSKPDRNLEQRVMSARSEESDLMDFFCDVLKGYTRGTYDENLALTYFRKGFSSLLNVLVNQEYQPEKKVIDNQIAYTYITKGE